MANGRILTSLAMLTAVPAAVVAGVGRLREWGAPA